MSARIKTFGFAGVLAAFALAYLLHGFGTDGADASAYALAFLPCVFILVDLVDAIVRVVARRRTEQALRATHGNSRNPWGSTLRAAPHAFVYLVRDIEHDLDAFLARRAGQRESSWIVDLGSEDHTVLRLRAAGWRCLEMTGRAGARPSLEKLLLELPVSINTIILLDEASVLATAARDPERFEQCLRDFQRSGAAAMTPRVLTLGERLGDRLLHLEAVLDFGLTRRALGDLASLDGPVIFRRDALQLLVTGEHAGSSVPNAEDTFVTLARGERVYCEPRLEAWSSAPASSGVWMRARAADWRVAARTFWQRRAEIDALAKRGPLAMYHYVFHTGLMQLFATPLRLVSALVVFGSFANTLDQLLGGTLIPDGIVTEPAVFALVYIKYLLLHVYMICMAAPRREWPALLALAPVYFFHTQLRGLPPFIAMFARPPGAPDPQVVNA